LNRGERDSMWREVLIWKLRKRIINRNLQRYKVDKIRIERSSSIRKSRGQIAYLDLGNISKRIKIYCLEVRKFRERKNLDNSS